MSLSNQNDTNASHKTKATRLEVSSRLYLVAGTAFVVGSAIGLVREGRKTSLQFLAENVHRPPTTVQGWYFYNKTKNYKVMLGGLKGATVEGGRLGMVGLGWVIMEETLAKVGWGGVKEVGAAVGTACMFSALYRLPWKAARQTVILGIMMGGVMKGLGMAKGGLEERTRSDAPINVE